MVTVKDDVLKLVDDLCMHCSHFLFLFLLILFSCMINMSDMVLVDSSEQ